MGNILRLASCTKSGNTWLRAFLPIKGKQFFRSGRANQWRDVLSRNRVARIVAEHREQMEHKRYLAAGY